MPNRLALCGLALLAALSVAGCGSDGGPKTAPSPTAKPTAPPDLVAPKPERPAAENTKQSAVEYGEWFARLVQYSLRTRSARPVQAEAFDLATCSVCLKLDTAVRDLRKQERWQITPDIQLGVFRAVPIAGGYTVEGRFVFPSGRFVKLDGTKVDAATGGKYRFEADLRWDATRSRWRVVDYTYLPTSRFR